MEVEIDEYTASDLGWQAYLDHLTWLNMANHATYGGEPKPDCTYLGARLGEAVIGNLSFRKQPLVVPMSPVSGGQEISLMGRNGMPLFEAFVQTFGVEPDQQRLWTHASTRGAEDSGGERLLSTALMVVSGQA